MNLAPNMYISVTPKIFVDSLNIVGDSITYGIKLYASPLYKNFRNLQWTMDWIACISGIQSSELWMSQDNQRNYDLDRTEAAKGIVL